MKFIGFLILVLLSNFAHAKCTVKRSDNVVVDHLVITLPKFSPPAFDPNIAEGTVIFTASGTSTGLGGKATCDSVVGQVGYFGPAGVAPGKYSTYPTPVSGVGLRIKGGINTDQWWPQSTTGTTTAWNLDGASDFTIELVKTGDITAAGVLSGEIGMTYLVAHEKKVRSIVTNGSINIIPKVPTCNVLTKNIAVDLGKALTGDLKNIGATSSPKSFDVRLKCSGGNPGTSTKMFMTMTDSANPANESDTLSLAVGSKAKGFGIQILRGSDDTLVSYGPDSAATGNTNQWSIGSFGNVDVTIPFKARYVRTSSTVSPGKADGAATFTMSYQ
ncbi:fimbrial protein [Burkholderia cepacia]|uniref:fimbrial protein n=1 Tax=Burkholderia cepacia TaxID=292 RepID=UPI00264FAEA3|nr:fimbrial protein [Burkholderia cepacia]MDN7857547.1 fimbrial protein [Burkholderia cepacia]